MGIIQSDVIWWLGNLELKHPQITQKYLINLEADILPASGTDNSST